MRRPLTPTCPRSLLARLGGHSAPRTHRGKERFPGPSSESAICARLLGFAAPEGMTITYALIQMVEKISERSDLARIINKAGSSHHGTMPQSRLKMSSGRSWRGLQRCEAKVKQLLMNNGAVCGVLYEKRGGMLA